MSRLYVAYGSNLNLSQMAMRCPYAKIYSIGLLKNWELIYRGSASNAHATIRRKKGVDVPVLVWEIQEYDETCLDIYEGFPRYYFKQDVMVEIKGHKKKAMVYIMNTHNAPGRPSPQYIETIKQGYIDNSFSLEYFNKTLETNNIECCSII